MRRFNSTLQEAMADIPVLRYSDAELEEFRILIEGKLAKAKEELEFMYQQIVEMNENTSDKTSGDQFDDSSLHVELEMLNRNVRRQQEFIRNLDNALLRIKNKTYGICSITGQLIEKKRLQLVPHATKSVAGKEEEKKVYIYHNRNRTDTFDEVGGVENNEWSADRDDEGGNSGGGGMGDFA